MGKKGKRHTTSESEKIAISPFLSLD